MYFLFFASAAMLIVVGVFALVPTMMRKTTSTGGDRKRSNIVVARQRIEELEKQQSEGALSEADANQLREEIERELLEDVQDIEAEDVIRDASKHARRNQFGIIAVALTVPLASGALYLLLGDPGAITRSKAPQSEVAQSSASDSASSSVSLSIEEIIHQLEERLRQQPDDHLAWMALAQAYVSQERFAKGAEAYAKLRELRGDTAELLVREADALAMAQGGNLAGEPELLLRRVLTLDPENPAALWLIGLAASARQDYRSALEFWSRAQAGIDDPEVRTELMSLMEDAQALLDAQAAADENNAASIQVSVSIDPGIAEAFGPDDTCRTYRLM